MYIAVQVIEDQRQCPEKIRNRATYQHLKQNAMHFRGGDDQKQTRNYTR